MNKRLRTWGLAGGFVAMITAPIVARSARLTLEDRGIGASWSEWAGVLAVIATFMLCPSVGIGLGYLTRRH